MKSYEQDFIKSRKAIPRPTFSDYLDEWRKQELPTDRSIQPDTLGVNWLSKYYLDSLYEFSTGLSLSEVLTDTDGWLPHATELSKTYKDVNYLGLSIAKRGNIFTEQDSRDLLECLLQIFDEETAILVFLISYFCPY